MVKNFAPRFLAKESVNFQKVLIGKNLIKDLQVSTGDLYRCVQFADMFPKLEELDIYVSELPNTRPGAKITWKWIKKELLPEHKEEKEPTKQGSKTTKQPSKGAGEQGNQPSKGGH